MFTKKMLMKTAECHPVYPPQLPTIEELKNSPNPKELMDEYFKGCEEAQARNRENFERALTRIKSCDNRTIMYNAFGLQDYYNKRHKDWCPLGEWNEFNEFMRVNPLNMRYTGSE